MYCPQNHGLSKATPTGCWCVYYGIFLNLANLSLCIFRPIYLDIRKLVIETVTTYNLCIKIDGVKMMDIQPDDIDVIPKLERAIYINKTVRFIIKIQQLY